jgi:hypothetical protein
LAMGGCFECVGAHGDAAFRVGECAFHYI